MITGWSTTFIFHVGHQRAPYRFARVSPADLRIVVTKGTRSVKSLNELSNLTKQSRKQMSRPNRPKVNPFLTKTIKAVIPLHLFVRIIGL